MNNYFGCVIEGGRRSREPSSPSKAQSPGRYDISPEGGTSDNACYQVPADMADNKLIDDTTLLGGFVGRCAMGAGRAVGDSGVREDRRGVEFNLDSQTRRGGRARMLHCRIARDDQAKTYSMHMAATSGCLQHLHRRDPAPDPAGGRDTLEQIGCEECAG